MRLRSTPIASASPPSPHSHADRIPKGLLRPRHVSRCVGAKNLQMPSWLNGSESALAKQLHLRYSAGRPEVEAFRPASHHLRSLRLSPRPLPTASGHGVPETGTFVRGLNYTPDGDVRNYPIDFMHACVGDSLGSLGCRYRRNGRE